uniref:Putative ixostatin n=1 Tax=Ixodes ricinus TaxID=34613 RepID=A0A0K8RC62_IXORI
MIRTVILPFSVVLLAASSYTAQTPKQDADKCSPGLREFITTVCSSSNATFGGFFDCTYTCEKKISQLQTSWTAHNMPNGLPCGNCKQCCDGKCTSVIFDFNNPLTLKPCAK